MKNRITDDLLGSPTQVSPPPTASNELLQTVQKQLDQGRRSMEKYIQNHPAIGIGTALCIGVIVGWISKRR